MVKHRCIQCSKKCVGDVLRIGEKYFHQKCFRCKDCNSYMDSGGYFVNDGKYYCPKDYNERFKKKCFICFNFIEKEIISALNINFHRSCFRCTLCRKIFSPGDRVTMKYNQFLCNLCNSDMEVKQMNITLQHSGGSKPTEGLFSKDLLSDDIPNDQGYISGDPISSSAPLANKSEGKKGISLTKRLFDFGKFYKTSYLDIQKREKDYSMRSSTRPSSLKVLNHFHLPAKAAEKHANNISSPIEKDDWPAPSLNYILLREKGLQNGKFSDIPVRCQSMYNPRDVDYTQSLADITPDIQCRSFSEVYKDFPSYYSNIMLNNEVISSSRFPDANMQPSSKPRYRNHLGKSKSRDSTYFNDNQRHKGYSLEYLSSTTRHFLAGSVPHEIYGSKVERGPSKIYSNLKPGYTQGLLHDMKIKISRKPISSETEDLERYIFGNSGRTCVNNSPNLYKYYSNFKETYTDNKIDFTYPEVDPVICLTRNKFSREKLQDQSSILDKSSTKSKSQSFVLQKALPIIKNFVVPYSDLISKEPKIMKGLDKTKLETYLSSEEFQQLFCLTQSAFYLLPEWKRNDLKIRVNLF